VHPGGARGLTDQDLQRAYRFERGSARLNHEQALELAMLIAGAAARAAAPTNVAGTAAP